MSSGLVENTVAARGETAPPTGIRFVVLGVLCLLSGILYLDRICIAAALDSIQTDLGLSHTSTSYVLMAFTLAYGLFEVPTGRWGDRIGARRVLTRISLWWSVFTALTGACTNLWMLLLVRFSFGAGEAGAFPNVARVLAKWFPDAERGRAQGLLLAASQIGGALAPFLAAVLIQAIGWRWTFAAFGGVGAVWAAGFWWWFRDEPATHPAVNAAEVAHIGLHASSGMVHAAIPWAAVARNPSIWFLGTIMTFASFNSYIYFSWFPKYLKAARGVEATEAGLMASMVLACAATGTFVGGLLLDRVVLGGGLARRRMFGGCAFFAAAGLLSAALFTREPWLAAGFTALSCFAAQSTQSLWWSSAIGISGRHVGALFGLMNSAGVFGAMSSQYLVGYLADRLGEQGYSGRAQWDPIFYIDLGVLTAAGLLWSTFRYVSVEPHAEEQVRVSLDPEN
jgi:ACS family glucarate transporter-like MFS transporter